MNKITLLLKVTNRISIKCDKLIRHESSFLYAFGLNKGSKPVRNKVPLAGSSTREVEDCEAYGNKLTLDNIPKIEEPEDCDNNQWAEYPHEKEAGDYRGRTEVKVQTKSINKSHRFFIKTSNNFDVVQTQRCFSFKPVIAILYNHIFIRSYTVPPKKKTGGDLLKCGKGGELGSCYTGFKDKRKKEAAIKTTEVEVKKEAETPITNEPKKTSSEITASQVVCPKVQIDKESSSLITTQSLNKQVKDETGQQSSSGISLATPIINEQKKTSSEITACQVVCPKVQIDKESCSPITTQSVNKQVKDETGQQSSSGISSAKSVKKPDKTHNDNEEKSTVHRTQIKICKRCHPQNKLLRYRPHPAWKVWLYSILGIELPEPMTHPPKRVCCRKLSKAELQIKWVRLKEPPKPFLEPSIKHLKRTPAARLQITRTEKKKSDVSNKKDHEEFFTKSLPISDRAKWASNIADKKGNETWKTLKKPYSPGPPSMSSLESIHQKTSEFCKTLEDLCKNKQNNCKTRTEDTKVDILKHLNGKKDENGKVEVCDKEKPKKTCNKLISNEEFKRKNNKKHSGMPEHYTCGAGEIERQMVLERKNKYPAEVVHFKYRDHCVRSKDEKLPKS